MTTILSYDGEPWVSYADYTAMIREREQATDERDEWRDLARRLARIVEAQREYESLNWHLVRTTGDGYQEYRRVDADLRAAHEDVTDEEIARATDGDRP